MNWNTTGYTPWNGTMDWSASDISVFVYAETVIDDSKGLKARDCEGIPRSWKRCQLRGWREDLCSTSPKIHMVLSRWKSQADWQYDSWECVISTINPTGRQLSIQQQQSTILNPPEFLYLFASEKMESRIPPDSEVKGDVWNGLCLSKNIRSMKSSYEYLWSHTFKVLHDRCIDMIHYFNLKFDYHTIYNTLLPFRGPTPIYCGDDTNCSAWQGITMWICICAQVVPMAKIIKNACESLGQMSGRMHANKTTKLKWWSESKKASAFNARMMPLISLW